MPTAKRSDPYGAYNFLITLINSGSSTSKQTMIGGFSECSGLEMSLETEDYQEGGNNGTVLKFPKHITYAPIRLKRGVTDTDELYQWFYSFVEGQGKRKDGKITLLDEQRNAVKVWKFVRGLPTKWTGPSLDAIHGQLAIQELEIVHEGLQMLPV